MAIKKKIALSDEGVAEWDILLGRLLHSHSKGDFIALFHYYAPKVKAYMIRGGFAPDEADELAQETMLALWRNYRSYDSAQASANTWIFTIARNKRIDGLRKRARPRPDDYTMEMITPPAADPEDISAQGDMAKKMSGILKKLPREQSRLVLLSYYQNKTHAEIAKSENLPLGTVKSRLRLALTKLKQLMQEENIEP